MKTLISFMAIVAMSISLAACQLNKQTVGAGVGGSGRTAAIIGGTLLGAMIGGHIGGEMDELDRRRANDALENSPSGYQTSWRNPDSGAQYNVTPTRTYDSSTGPCRDYEMDVYIDGQRDVVKGTACRNARGEWINQ